MFRRRARPKRDEPEVVGPFSGLRLRQVARQGRADEHRRTLIDQKRRLRGRHRDLAARAAPQWRVGRRPVAYPRRLLGANDVRDEAAIVDEYLAMQAFQTRRGRSVGESHRVFTEHKRDDRVWRSVVRREREFMRRFLRPQERIVLFWLAPQKSALRAVLLRRRRLRRRRPGRAALWTLLLAMPIGIAWLFVRMQEALLVGFVKVQAAVAHKSVDLPILVKEGARETRSEFGSREGRRGLLRALLDESYMTPERRRVILFVGSIVLFFLWLGIDLLIRLAYPQAVSAKLEADRVFVYSVATRIFLPLPYELILPAAASKIGIAATVVSAALGAVVGCWLIFIIGVEVNKGIGRMIRSRPGLNASFRWLERNARRYGYLVLGAILCVPLGPDTAPILVFSLLKLELKWFLLTVFASTIVRSLAWLLFWPSVVSLF